MAAVTILQLRRIQLASVLVAVAIIGGPIHFHYNQSIGVTYLFTLHLILANTRGGIRSCNSLLRLAVVSSWMLLGLLVVLARVLILLNVNVGDLLVSHTNRGL